MSYSQHHCDLCNRTTNHTTEQHRCKVCNQSGHKSVECTVKVKCEWCNKVTNHSTENHICMKCYALNDHLTKNCSSQRVSKGLRNRDGCKYCGLVNHHANDRCPSYTLTARYNNTPNVTRALIECMGNQQTEITVKPELVVTFTLRDMSDHSNHSDSTDFRTKNLKVNFNKETEINSFVSRFPSYNYDKEFLMSLLLNLCYLREFSDQLNVRELFRELFDGSYKYSKSDCGRCNLKRWLMVK